MRNRGRKHWMFSVILLVVGIWLLMLNIGVISLEITQIFVTIVPAILVIIGVKWVADAFLRKSFGKLLFGLFSLVLGSLRILAELNLLEFEYGSWWKLWPIFIIAVAISRVAWNKSIKVTVTNDHHDEDYEFESQDPHAAKTVTNRVNRGFIVGEVKFAEPNWPLEPMIFQNVVGDYYFDFSKAFIPEGETPIEIKGWVGDVKVVIPENVPVEIKVKVKVGEVKLFNQGSSEIRSDFYYKSPGYEQSGKRIKLQINVKVASIRISEV
ncbi:cell wall-active antibiotics response protein LiaF [Rossellomorea aquimaris]|uniref:cell wall-active antibiotics response protein LiaF n=1 Tax=Rossellomorea aquimaris TaxID=189382 RepID=UPI001CD52CBA|nr:cell wall-active antibiotics response protein LiaF [Rossellomorea aquimaris]MCA1056463.1 cell wall-active antibiotics response protein LiaF [Rossellomorea aquimaris]